MRLTKHHGLGNDFLVLLDLDGTRPVSPEQAAALCDRRTGRRRRRAPARHRRAPTAPTSRWSCSTPTARRAEMSGNGIRCLAQAVFQAGLAAPPVLTRRHRRRAAHRHASSSRADARTAPHERRHGAGQGRRRTSPSGSEGDVLEAARVDVGNPHLVLRWGGAELPERDELDRHRRPHRRRHARRRQRRDRAARRHAPASSTWSCTSAASAPPTPAAPAPAPVAAAAHEWELVRPHRHRPHARRPGRGHASATRWCSPATSPSSPSSTRRGRSGALHRMSLIERSFREKIVLVGVTLPPATAEDTEAGLDELVAARRHRRRRRGRARRAAPRRARPAHLHRQGQGRGAPRARAGHRLRHRRVRQRAHARPSSATSRSCSAAPPSTAPR